MRTNGKMTPILNNETLPYSSMAISEVALDSLRADDCLLVTTANATYSFLVVDPGKHRGILTGGVLGSKSVSAILLGAEVIKSGQVSALFSKVCEGSRAIFFVAAAECVQQLVTSTIIRLVHTRISAAQFS